MRQLTDRGPRDEPGHPIPFRDEWLIHGGHGYRRHANWLLERLERREAEHRVIRDRITGLQATPEFRQVCEDRRPGSYEILEKQRGDSPRGPAVA